MIQEKEQRIIRVTEELYAKYGIKSITMEDVASSLGISKKTLYQFVSDKEELVEKVINSHAREKLEEFAAIFDEKKNAIDELFDLIDFIKQMFKEHNPAREYDLLKYYPELYNALKIKKREHIFKAFRENIEKGKQQGLYRQDTDAELISKLHVFRVENIIDNDLFDKEELTSPDFCLEIIIYHIRGIATSEGITYLEKKLKTNELING
ncbi:MAG: TetR/AcrR family transcriptional regulator [Bacteroidales bacterium]|nr:TetR/AcrR family transcriptional regulator [Bacteroidales bacterium]MCF8386808.1 TetR/AcrR family transcriptional regulator [Bacteroidales bacterium]MCF8397053.1 TetR/AcrR family transcriptional regulator [Bacteroidales bacterium]